MLCSSRAPATRVNEPWEPCLLQSSGAPKHSSPIARTKVRTRDGYLVHEPQNLFCYIVGGVTTPPCGVPLSVA